MQAFCLYDIYLVLSKTGLQWNDCFSRKYLDLNKFVWGLESFHLWGCVGRLWHLAKQSNAECASFGNAHRQSGQTGMLTTIEAMNISTVELESSWLALDIELQKFFAFYENRSSNLFDIMADLFLFLSPVSTNRQFNHAAYVCNRCWGIGSRTKSLWDITIIFIIFQPRF